MTTSDKPGCDLSAVLKDSPVSVVDAETGEFADLIAVIEQARVNAFWAVNRELIAMYTEIGQRVSERTKSDGWGKANIARFSEQVQRSIQEGQTFQEELLMDRRHHRSGWR